MTELKFLKDLMLIRQANQKSLIFATVGNFLNKGFKFQRYVCNRYHHLLTMSMNFHDIVFLKIKGF